MNKVAILLNQSPAMFELGYALELFALPAQRYPEWYQTEVVAFGPQTQRAIGGLEVRAKQVSSLEAYDMLVVPGWPYAQMDPDVDLSLSIRQLIARGGRVLSFCTGSFLLAELGLLNDKKATTHWAYADDFRRRFPDVEYLDNVLYVYDGQIGCSAGSAAGIDLSLTVIRADYGYQIANQVARRLVMSPHRSGGQCQFVDAPLLQNPTRFSEALDWATRNIRAKISIDRLANRALMSRRSFDRKFRAGFGMSPQQWLIQQRIVLAKELLESSELSIDEIATHVGFESVVTLRHHFRRLVTLSPRQYRDQFGHRNEGVTGNQSSA